MNATTHPDGTTTLRLRRLGIDTYQEPVVYMSAECPVCRSEGWNAETRLRVALDGRQIIATLNVLTGPLLAADEASLSEAAWRSLGGREGGRLTVSSAPPLLSLSHVRAKIYGGRLDPRGLDAIVRDIAAGRYSAIELSAFVTACATGRLDRDETIGLTRAMIDAGERMTWGRAPIVDKHSVGGLPGNRTTPLVVPIVAAHGLTIPKTSSRAITSPAGTADTMETLAPVALDIPATRRVVEREGGCIVWGGAIRLSPADDIIIRVERPLDLDSEGQLVASVLSKKAAAGSTHVVIDLPVGPTAKLRTVQAARSLGARLIDVGAAIGLQIDVVEGDGSQPIGRGIGPALEAWDILAVLQGRADAPGDLRERALTLAGRVLEVAGAVSSGAGTEAARAVLDDGRAWRKFQAICDAQGGMRTPPRARLIRPFPAPRAGRIATIDNRRLARVAKLAGAPKSPAAGLELHMRLGAWADTGQPLFTLHADSPGELTYAWEFVAANPDVVRVDEVG